MNCRFLGLQLQTITLVAGVLSLTVALTAATPAGVSVPNVTPAPPQSPATASQQLAKSITVKVLSSSESGWGSGTLIQQQGDVYTAVTNEHVLVAGDPPYRIQTPDGKIHPATVKLRGASFQGNDLALLQFRSTGTVYPVAKLGATPAPGDEVFAGGFPFSYEASLPTNSPTGLEGFKFTAGKVSLVLDKALEGGYQLGYTNDIEKGMSGGPVLNRAGALVGINGMHAYPLWGDPYIFQDGSEPTPQMREQMIPLAFAIPVGTFTQNLQADRGTPAR
ncbi:MAG: serine protease [Oscillatoria princeps RMCB-10]|jgi:S1-C subfamily serine protease|nr:serine protease [Oscillatoria princeps RMCB-10]